MWWRPVILFVVSACGRIGFDGIDPIDDAGTDAPAPWGPPALIAITGGGLDDDPTLTPDALELYFERNRDIFVATRAAIGAPWSTPMLVASLSVSATDTTPELAPDGLTMYLSSARAGGLGDFDILTSQRATLGAPWPPPTFVPELSTPSFESAGTTTADSLAIAIDSARGGIDTDIWLSVRTDSSAPWEAPVHATALSTPELDEDPFLSPDGLTIYFGSRRGGNLDIYVATREDRSDPFGPPGALADIRTGFVETDPWVSADGRTLVFMSDRDGSRQLYEAVR
jgi:hypothetical protein